MLVKKTWRSGKHGFGLGAATVRGTSTIKQLYVCLGIVSRVTIDIKLEKEAEASSGRRGRGGWGLGKGGLVLN